MGNSGGKLVDFRDCGLFWFRFRFEFVFEVCVLEEKLEEKVLGLGVCFSS